MVKTWDDCKDLFLNKFYPIQRTIQARRAILNFEQGSHESFSDAWDRLKSYTKDCPHHGFGKGELLSIFYRGVVRENKWTLDVASKGCFSKLDVDQGELLVENLSRSFEGYKGWDDAIPLEDSCQDSNLQIFQDATKRDEKMEALNDKLDKQAALMEKRASLFDKLLPSSKKESHHTATYDQDVVHEEEVHYVGNQAYNPKQTQASNQAPPQADLIIMMQQMLSGQGALNTKIADMEDEIKQLKTQSASSSRQDQLPGQPEANPRNDALRKEKDELEASKSGAIALAEARKMKAKVVDEEDTTKPKYIPPPPYVPKLPYPGRFTKQLIGEYKAMLDKANKKVEEKSDVEAPKVAYMGGYSTILDSLFSTTMEKEVKGATKCTKTKKEEPEDNHLSTLQPSSSTMTLTPWKYEDGTIEYKVKCKGRTKPFAKARAILSTELKEKGQSGIQEVMDNELLLEFKDPPWSVHPPLSFT